MAYNHDRSFETVALIVQVYGIRIMSRYAKVDRA